MFTYVHMLQYMLHTYITLEFFLNIFFFSIFHLLRDNLAFPDQCFQLTICEFNKLQKIYLLFFILFLLH